MQITDRQRFYMKSLLVLYVMVRRTKENYMA